MGISKNKSTDDFNFYENRHRLILNMFKDLSLNIEVRKLNYKNVALIHNGNEVINCRSKGNLIKFIDEFNDEVLLELNLETDKIDENWLKEYIESYPQKKVYRIQYEDSPLYVSGYNFLIKGDESTKYPVFSSKGCKIYFVKEHAIEIAEHFGKKMNAKLNVVQ